MRFAPATIGRRSLPHSSGPGRARSGRVDRGAGLCRA